MPRIVSMKDRFEAHKKAQTKSSTSTDTLGAVKSLLGANCEKIKVGQGLQLKFQDGDENGRKTMAIARSRLIAVSREGQPWAGQDWKVWIDKEQPGIVNVMRSDDLETPRAAKVGGRKKGTTNKPKAGVPSLQEAMGMGREHLNGSGEENTDPEIKETMIKDLTA